MTKTIDFPNPLRVRPSVKSFSGYVCSKLLTLCKFLCCRRRGRRNGNTLRLNQYAREISTDFTAGLDGSTPFAGLTIDKAGSLHGTSYYGEGGPCKNGFGIGCGTVFQLTHHRGSGWTLNPLYKFTGNGNDDGAYPAARVVFGQDGTLYGTTAGGIGNGTGAVPGATVFELTPSNGKWTLSVLSSFGANSNEGPDDSLFMDAAGNLYGTAYGGGRYGYGLVFKLTPSGGGWTFTDLHDFSGRDGAYPIGGVVQDANGNLYGAASEGGQYGYGVVWEITPTP